MGAQRVLEQGDLPVRGGNVGIDAPAANGQAWLPYVDHARDDDDALHVGLPKQPRCGFFGLAPERLDQGLHGAASGSSEETETPFVSGASHEAGAPKQRSRARVNDRPAGVRSTRRMQGIRRAVVDSRAAKRHAYPGTQLDLPLSTLVNGPTAGSELPPPDASRRGVLQ